MPEKITDDADPAAVRNARLSELLLRSSISDCTLSWTVDASDVLVENRRWWGVVNASADDNAAMSTRAIDVVRLDD